MAITIAQKNNKLILVPSYFIRIAQLGKSFKWQTVLIYSLFFLLSVGLVSSFTKSTLHLALNKYHSPFFDAFFKYSTFLGDGVMFGILFLIFQFINKKVAYAFAISGVLTLLVTHLFKKVLFRGVPRPLGFFEEEALHLVEGVKMAAWNAFPSGHTTTAFAIFTILCLYFNKCKSQYLWVTLAIIAGLSRVYLSQHFWMDIFVGSAFGIIIGFVSMSFFYRIKRVH